MKKFFTDAMDYFKDLSKTGLILWITALVVVVLLIVILIFKQVKSHKMKKRLYRDTLTGKKNYQFFVKKLAKKYRNDNYVLAIVDFKDTNELRETYDRVLYKSIIVEFFNIIKNTTKRKDYCARTEYNEFVIAYRKNKKLDITKKLDELTTALSNLTINKNLVNPVFKISYSEGFGDKLLVELNRIVIALNQSIQKITQVTSTLIEENTKYVSLSLAVNKEDNNDLGNLIFKPIVDFKYAKIKMAMCGLRLNDLTTFDNTFSNVIKRDNLAYDISKCIIQKLKEVYIDELDIALVIPCSFSFTLDMLNSLDKDIIDANLPKNSIILGFESSEYYNLDPSLNIDYFKNSGYKLGLLNMDSRLDLNAFMDFDFISLSNDFIKRYRLTENKENYNNLLEVSNSIKAIKIDSEEDISVLKNESEYPYIFSDTYFSLLTIEELISFNRIQRLVSEEEFSKVYQNVVVLPDEEEKEIEILPRSSSSDDEETVEDVVEESNDLETESIEIDEVNLEDEDEENDESELEVEENSDTNTQGFKFPTVKTKPFPQKILDATEEAKEYFNALNNKLNQYKGVKHQIAKPGESFRYKNKTCARIRLVGKTLRIYLDLNPSLYPTTRFHQRDVSEIKKYARTPMMVKIKSSTGLKKAFFLIDDMAKIYDMVLEEKPSIDFMDEIISSIK